MAFKLRMTVYTCMAYKLTIASMTLTLTLKTFERLVRLALLFKKTIALSIHRDFELWKMQLHRRKERKRQLPKEEG